ncbi:hypothetical protein JCM19233_6491 [Vibrio astriarenae]|nr:hypothetical protein JCM19233_6491 [Vibrio sp. C7]
MPEKKKPLINQRLFLLTNSGGERKFVGELFGLASLQLS